MPKKFVVALETYILLSGPIENMNIRIPSFKKTVLVTGIAILSIPSFAQQNQLSLFNLKDVKLHTGLFEEAMYTDLDYILQMEPDRLLAPFLREAGLQPKAESYPNWENTGLDGHIGGHYLTALAQMYASAGSDEALQRLNCALHSRRWMRISRW